MPRQRFGVHFEDERRDDRSVWSSWVYAVVHPLRGVASMGELRPLIEVELRVEGEWAAVVLAHSLDRR